MAFKPNAAVKKRKKIPKKQCSIQKKRIFAAEFESITRSEIGAQWCNWQHD